jgi:NADPH:quinone reductase-like Zn-dependent oxidoreductase
MKAMMYYAYGSPDVLELREIEKPVVKEDDVLVRVHAASLNWRDWHFLTGAPFLARIMAGLLKPRNQVLGIDLAGRVEAVGRNIERFQPDDEVFGGSGRGGTFAEYVCVREDEVQLKPSNTTYEEGAAVGAAAAVALQGIRDMGKVKPGQQLLVNGASGGVGAFAVQIGKSFGAEVTGVCSTRNLDLVRSIGADRVIDYTQEDFTRSGKCYDLVFDATAKLTFSGCTHVLSPNGIYVTTAFSPLLALRGLWISKTGSKRMVPFLAKPPSPADQSFVKDLLEAGRVKPVIDRTYALVDLPEAVRYLGTGHARGKVVITI